MHASEVTAQTHRVLDIPAIRKDKEVLSARDHAAASAAKGGKVSPNGSESGASQQQRDPMSSFYSGGSEFEQVKGEDRAMQHIDLGSPRPGRQ